MPGAETGPAGTAGAAASGLATAPGRLSRLASLLSSAGQALLPGTCVLCGAAADGGAQTCRECHTQIFGTARPRCRVCANPLPETWHQGSGAVDGCGGGTLGDGNGTARSAPSPAPRGAGSTVCGRCLAHPPAFDATVAAADYAMPQDQLVLQLKFGGRLALAALFGRALADAVLATPGFIAPAVLCPVPLGPQRLAGRGFNQALEIARALARRLDIAVHPRLAARVHDTVAQSLVQPSERRANIARAFAVPDRALVEGRHIGIVDDVMTSGQTMDELAATFKRHGAARVTCLVFARTPPH